MEYFVMCCDGVYPSAAIAKGPDLGNDAPWVFGKPLRKIPEGPLIYTLDPQRTGNICAMYDAISHPIMRDDLVEALTAAGATNLELFEAHILDPVTAIRHTNYKAFNVLGWVSAADMNRSQLAEGSTSTLIDVEFDRLSIDPDRAKASGLHLFRLAESVTTIIVDERVKNEVEGRKIP